MKNQCCFKLVLQLTLLL